MAVNVPYTPAPNQLLSYSLKFTVISACFVNILMYILINVKRCYWFSDDVKRVFISTMQLQRVFGGADTSSESVLRHIINRIN